VALLRDVAEAGMLTAIARGWFADTPRAPDGGRGLEGVAERSPGYFNPFLELWHGEGAGTGRAVHA
jgi:beta-lysine 5,6-aminomutase alpha subunit